jgi:hypothetical protein
MDPTSCRTIFLDVGDQWHERPACTQPQPCHVARQRKIWQWSLCLPAREAVIERRTGDTQMDLDDAFRLSMGQEHVLKQPQDNVFWSFCTSIWCQPAGCLLKQKCMQNMAKGPYTIATGH